MINRRIVIEEPGKVVLKESDMPKRERGEALLKVLYGGICGSDLNSYRGTSPYVSYPRTPGHEFSAEIVEIDENEAGLGKGMLVTANPYFNCGHCYSCQRGLVNCCTTNQTMGVQREGAFSQYITMPVERLYDSQGLDPRTLSLIEPFCIGYHGVRRAKPEPGEHILIVGAGTIGLMAATAAKEFGAIVTVCDISEKKARDALAFGADYSFVNSGPEELAAQTGRITGGNGFDITVEAVGLPSTFQDCMDAASFGARVVLIGVGKDTLDFNFTMIQKKELFIIGSRNAVKRDFQETIRFVKESRMDLSKIVTRIYPMQDCARAFSDFDKNSASTLKVLMDFV